MPTNQIDTALTFPSDLISATSRQGSRIRNCPIVFLSLMATIRRENFTSPRLPRADVSAFIVNARHPSRVRLLTPRLAVITARINLDLSGTCNAIVAQTTSCAWHRLAVASDYFHLINLPEAIVMYLIERRSCQCVRTSDVVRVCVLG